MTRNAPPSGMTLIELIVALGVATLVFMSSVSVYLVVTASLRRQQDKTHSAAASALDQLRHDLASCAQSISSNRPAFEVECPAHETNVPGLASLAFSTGRIPSPEDDFSRLEIERVHYGVVPAPPGEGDGGTLIRETMTLWGPNAFAPAVSNPVMQGVTAFDVSVLPDSLWTNTWKSTTRTLFPRAVRIRMDWRTAVTSETATVDVFIPAGNPIQVTAGK
ncbi:MAG: type II secretion system protein GspJ [bacterium]|jgi:prepilin-type N-terminal cleavage/methylation domain-containing protein